MMLGVGVDRMAVAAPIERPQRPMVVTVPLWDE